VLDLTMGIGSTGIAAANTGRQFVGIENETEFLRIATEVLGASRWDSA